MTLPQAAPPMNLGAVANFETYLFGGRPATIPYTTSGAPANGGSGTLAGVAAPGALLLDEAGGALYVNQGTQAAPVWARFFPTTVAAGLTASTTQTLAGALPLTARWNQLSTVAHAGDAVSLPAMMAGQRCTVYNDGANAASVFPSAAGIAIDGHAAGAAATLSAGNRARFYCKTATAIVSAQLGAVSA